MKRLWKRARGQPSVGRRYVVAEGVRLYAIGDIHGCRRELERLLSRIEHDLSGWNGHSELIFLGDYVDRGPDSAGVLELLSGHSLAGNRQIFLRGNHEEAMLACLDGTGNVPDWLTYGGLQTLESYGLTRSDLFKTSFDLKAWGLNAFPAAHRTFLEGLHDSYQAHDHIFVHAGVRPGLALEQQSPSDFRWIRHEFINDDRDHGAMVVHGHTISRQAVERSNRIGIDTGCYLSGKLTAVVLEGDQRRFLDSRSA